MGYTYKQLRVWQRSIDFVTRIYEVTQSFPKSEIYGLASQMRRCAVSIPSNIAEGQGRLGRIEFRQFLGIARGSLLELETQLLIAEKLGYIQETVSRELFAISDDISRMLQGLLQSMSKVEADTRNPKPETRNV